MLVHMKPKIKTFSTVHGWATSSVCVSQRGGGVTQQFLVENYSWKHLTTPPKKKKPSSLQCDLGIIGLICWWSTWLKHLLHKVEADTCFALVLSHSKVVEQVKMPHVGAVRVAVLIDQPFPFAGVGVSCANILGLKMLKLTVDVVTVGHSCWDESQRL